MSKKLSKNDFKIDPRVTEFIDHLEGGLVAAGLNFNDYHPQYVKLQQVDASSKTYDGLIFSQVAKSEDPIYQVCVANDGVHFYGANSSKLPFNFDQSPSRVAILFLVAMIKEEIIDPPNCPHCQEDK